MPQDEDWKILAEEAAHEQDPKKLIEIINSLNAAIDAQVIRKEPAQQATLGRKADAAAAVKPLQRVGES